MCETGTHRRQALGPATPLARMDRRQFLAGLGGVSATGLAGCVLRPPGTSGTARRGSAQSGSAPTRSARSESTVPGSGTAGTEPLGAAGFPPTICSEVPQADPGIYAITDPAVAPDWHDRRIAARYRPDGAAGLGADRTVIGLERDGTARAYPLSVLWVHEVVDDTLAGVPVLVTYCSLCRSAMVARRVVDGAATTFRVTGLLWQAPRVRQAASEAEGRVVGAVRSGGEELPVRNSGNVVLVDDATGSYWSQVLARAICGPREKTLLPQVPARVTTWDAWRRAHPDTDVLLPPPYSGTTNAAGG